MNPSLSYLIVNVNYNYPNIIRILKAGIKDMTNQDLIKKCKTFAHDVCKKSVEYKELWRHTLYVRQCSLQLAEIENADTLVVEIASLFHDIGQSINYHDHHIESCNLAKEFLHKLKGDNNIITDQRKDLIYKCIYKHRSRFSKEKNNEVEVKIVQSGDMLSRLLDDEYYSSIIKNSGVHGLEFWYNRTMTKMNLKSAFDLASDQINKIKHAIENNSKTNRCK